MANQTPVSVVPHEVEFSTQQAADYLNVSRPYLIKKLEGGEMSFRKIGKHRRVKFLDLIEYERRSRQAQTEAQVALHSEENGLGLE
jgi:excisionase family DNA binding protein